MINFDSLTLKAQLNEIAEIISAGRVQKVQQPTRKDLLLSIRSLGKNHKLYISINPKYPHICILDPLKDRSRNIEIPQKPPMFCMLLRKYLEGAKIKAVNQPAHERIVEIYFESYNEIGEKIPLVLAIELMGKHSNIVLYSYDTNVIIGCAHNIGAEKSREREMAGGLPYIYPPKTKKIDIRTLPALEFISFAKKSSEPLNIFLNKNFHDISLALANELCKNSSQEKLSELHALACSAVSLEGLKPSISSDFELYSLFSFNQDEKQVQKFSVNDMVDEYFAYHMYKDNFSRLKNTLTATLKKELAKEKKKLEQQSISDETFQKSERYKTYGDLIMANLYQIESGEDKVALENFYDEMKNIEIPLNSTLSANENAQKYYKLYTKAKNAIKIASERRVSILAQINYLESIFISLHHAVKIEDLNEIKEELESEDIIKNSALSPQKKKQKKEIQIENIKIQGFSVYIGKNNKQNDYIVSKIASSEDIWLHAQEIPGSHVLIKIPPDIKEIPDEVIFEGAKLAANFSKFSGAAKIPVIYTLKKYIKKPPCAKPGYVTYSHEKTIVVD